VQPEAVRGGDVCFEAVAHHHVCSGVTPAAAVRDERPRRVCQRRIRLR
jgi:hypothetical protein